LSVFDFVVTLTGSWSNFIEKALEFDFFLDFVRRFRRKCDWNLWETLRLLSKLIGNCGWYRIIVPFDNSNFDFPTLVLIPPCVRYIESCFEKWIPLQEIKFSSNSELQEIHGFNGCSSISRIEIPLSVETIWGFCRCQLLDEVVFSSWKFNHNCSRNSWMSFTELNWNFFTISWISFKLFLLNSDIFYGRELAIRIGLFSFDDLMIIACWMIPWEVLVVFRIFWLMEENEEWFLQFQIH
jgi:hypothetical protein